MKKPGVFAIHLSEVCVAAKADLNLGWVHKPFCRFCHAVA